MKKKSTDRYKFTPLHPGVHLRDYLEAQGMSTSEFAAEARLPNEFVDAVLDGKAGITRDMAVEIERVLGGGAGMWLNIDHAYRQWKDGLQ